MITKKSGEEGILGHTVENLMKIKNSCEELGRGGNVELLKRVNEALEIKKLEGRVGYGQKV